MVDAPPDLVLDSIQGQGYELRDWLTSYPFLLIAIDPYTHESAWILETAGRILHHYSPSDIRCGFLVTAGDDDCRQFLGPWAEDFLTFADPDRTAVEAFGLEHLPAMVVVRPDLSIQTADGWNPEAWRAIAGDLAQMLHWSRPQIPAPGDPAPYQGSPAIV